MNLVYLVPLILLPWLSDVPGQPRDTDLTATAQRLAQEIIILDTHVDTPYRLWNNPEDISNHTEKGDFDYPRARQGGLNALFMAVFTSPETERKGTARALADSLIDMVEGFPVKWPEKFEIVSTVEAVRRTSRGEKIAILLGMENAAPIAGDLRNLEYFYGRGVRYITLAHAEDNHICDSSFDDSRTWKGVSPFGRAVIKEMNRLGIMIDVSHISDDAFYQVMELSEAPVIASHSGCRHFTPGWERNMSDDMISLLAEKGGVIHINFGSIFVNDDCRRRFSEGQQRAERFAKENNLGWRDKRVREIWTEYLKENPIGFADISDVANHIDHVIELVGVNHVGFGSDFDGLGDSLPVGLKDVSDYPNLIHELLKKGHSEKDIENICSGNLFRVMKEVERVSKAMKERN
ncbi:MAG: dipeptidase [Candidatus Latescibacterota bacterium]|nr:MAG: dipeptidase [Candidatus Latescibacterota bacterium]